MTDEFLSLTDLNVSRSLRQAMESQPWNPSHGIPAAMSATVKAVLDPREVPIVPHERILERYGRGGVRIFPVDVRDPVKRDIESPDAVDGRFIGRSSWG